MQTDKGKDNKTELANSDPSKTVLNSKISNTGQKKRKTYRTNKNAIIGAWIRNRYKILEKVGEGGMGEVYLALDKKTGDTVAVKLLFDVYSRDKLYINRFNKEVSIGKKLDNEHIIKIMVSGKLRGRYYAVMEYAKGITLREYIDRAQKGEIKTSINDIKSIILQIAHALSYAYKNGLAAHRDIKPENIIIDIQTKQIKVADFGIAKVGSADISKSSTSNIFTLTYASPEQLFPNELGIKQLDQRTDIYSLGLILYEMITGKLPFSTEGTTAEVIGNKIAAIKSSASFPIPNDIPEYIRNVLDKSLRVKPDERYSSIDELISDLENENINNNANNKYTLTLKGASLDCRILVDDSSANFLYKDGSALITLPGGTHKISVYDGDLFFEKNLKIKDNMTLERSSLSKLEDDKSKSSIPTNKKVTKTASSSQTAKKPRPLKSAGFKKLFVSLTFLIFIDSWLYYSLGYLIFYKNYQIHIAKHLNFNLASSSISTYKSPLAFVAFLAAIGIFILIPEIFLLPVLVGYIKTRTKKAVKKGSVGISLVSSFFLASVLTVRDVDKLSFRLPHAYKLFYILQFGIIRYFLIFITFSMPIFLIVKYFIPRYNQIAHTIKYASWWGIILSFSTFFFIHISNQTVLFRLPQSHDILRNFMLLSPSIVFSQSKKLMLYLSQISSINFFYLTLSIMWTYTTVFIFPIILLKDILHTFWKKPNRTVSNQRWFWISAAIGIATGSLRLIEAAQNNVNGLTNFIFYSIYYFFATFMVLLILDIYNYTRRRAKPIPEKANKENAVATK